MKLTGGVLHAHAWRTLATLSDEQVQQLAAIRKRLSGPEEDGAVHPIEVVAAPSGTDDGA